LVGVKTPTGTTDERDNEGELFETEFQPGSGSWDPLIGLAVTRGFGRWSLDSNVLYSLATEGVQQTDLGDRFHYNGAISYRLIGAGNVMTQCTSIAMALRIITMSIKRMAAALQSMQPLRSTASGKRSRTSRGRPIPTLEATSCISLRG
jgi:hypothetical protein